MTNREIGQQIDDLRKEIEALRARIWMLEIRTADPVCHIAIEPAWEWESDTDSSDGTLYDIRYSTTSRPG